MRKQSTGLKQALALVLFSSTVPNFAQDRPPETVAGGQKVTTDDLKNAQAVKTFTPGEFAAATDRYTAEQCKKGTLYSKTDGSSFSIGESNYSIEEFADELVRRYKQKPFYCVDISGPGYDVKWVSKLLHRVKDVTEIESIKWAPDLAK